MSTARRSYFSDCSLQRLVVVYMILCRVDRVWHCTSTSTLNHVVPFYVSFQPRFSHCSYKDWNPALFCNFLLSLSNNLLYAISHIYDNFPSFINELFMCSFNLWKWNKCIKYLTLIYRFCLILLCSWGCLNHHNLQTRFLEPWLVILWVCLRIMFNWYDVHSATYAFEWCRPFC